MYPGDNMSIRVAQNLPSTRYTNFPHGMKFYGSSIVEKYKKNHSLNQGISKTLYIVPTVDLTESKKDHKKIQKKSPPKSRNINEYIYSTNTRHDRIKKNQKKIKKRSK